jgi:hypothetical protein
MSEQIWQRGKANASLFFLKLYGFLSICEGAVPKVGQALE